MPKRPRAHQLEQESIVALQSILNHHNWLFEQFDNDYGIDGRIEIFQGDHATGKICLAQLKATDEQDLDKALRLAVPLETIRYWIDIDIPVCIIRYVAANQTLYYRWIRNFAEIWEAESEQQTVTLHWHADDVLCASSLLTFKQQLDLIKQLNFQNVRLPISVNLTVADTAADANELTQTFVEACEMITPVYFVRRGANATFHVSRKDIVTSFGGIISTRWPLPTAQDYPRSRLPFDLIAMLADILLKLGLHVAAARLALHLVGHSSFLESVVPDDDMRWLITHLDQSEVMQQAELRLAKKDGDAAQQLVSFLLGAKALEPEILDRLIALNRTYAALARSHPESSQMIGPAMYNLASSLRWMGRATEALVALDLCGSVAPKYVERYSWWMDRGNLEAQLGKYQAAYASYQEAYRLVTRVPMVADHAYEILLFAAKAAFFAGQFADALNLTREAARQCESVGEEALLIQFAAQEIVGYGVQRQDAQPGRAAQVLNAPIKAPERFKRAVRLHALNPEVWQLKLTLDMEEGRLLDAAKAACIALLLSYEEEEVAQAAILLLTHIQVRQHLSYDLFLCALIVAYQAHGLPFFIRAEERLRQQQARPGLIEELRTLGDDIAHATQQASQLRYKVETPWGITILPWRQPSLLPLLHRNTEIRFERLEPS
ncbi:DUF4365 domain-containing protein [Deinococcus sp. HMF7620]|uniref:DUF4365 domain-containing protein n=1 Tax=Deinococcus arboris TaxID=2682977 RepID=A0A7C9HUA2_9DEIO|nr:DUF4365 domain-containing protein [Deinococcus arboris]MVN89229.1 DUF4365 domain-containing protein [Deinococcus arboris]